MILKHAIRYLELTGSDFITDLKDFADLQNSFVAGYIPVSYTHLDVYKRQVYLSL